MATKKIFSSWAQIVFLYFTGFSIFFIAAFAIVNLRISYKGEIKVPSLIGRMYLDEHNHLEKVGFKVKLEKIHSLEYPYGYIISQSLSPGDVVKFGQKLTLSVNHSKTLVETPKLIGSFVSLASKILGNIHSSGRRYRLNVGVVTRIPSKYPKGEILSQYPPPETPVVPEYPVSLLVSNGAFPDNITSPKDSAEGNTLLPSPKKINRLNIEIVKGIAYHLNIPLDIETSPTIEFEKNGFVLESAPLTLNILSKEIRKAVWKVKIAKYEPLETRVDIDYPFYFVWLDIDDLDIGEGRYTISSLRHKEGFDVLRNAKDHVIFSYISFKKYNKVPFFRSVGDEELLIWKDHFSPAQGEANISQKSEDVEPFRVYSLK